MVLTLCTAYGEKEEATQGKSKRSITTLGRWAERILLKDADEVGRAGNKIFYSKQGGYEQALVDFNDAKPKSVHDRVVHHGRVAKAGMIGDRQMVLLKQEWANPATIEITKLRNVGVSGRNYPAKVILYYD